MVLKYMLALSLLYTAGLLSATTMQIAELNEHYPSFIYALHGRVRNFLLGKDIAMKLDVQSLLSRDLVNEGLYFENLDADLYDLMQEQFDDEFTRLDKKLLEGAYRLDNENASTKVKTKFIRMLKADATAAIDSLIQHYSV